MRKKNFLNDNLLEILKKKFTQKAQLTNMLIDILDIEKEAVYRRLRGDVAFTTSEVSMISQRIGISLDSILGLESMKSRPFYLKLLNYADPQKKDYEMVDEFNGLLSEIRNEPDTVLCSATKMIPDVFHLRYRYLTTFYLFKWIYQYSNPGQMKPFREVQGTDQILEKLGRMMLLYQEIKNQYFVLDKMLFQNLVDDIRYFVEINLIDPSESQLLKNDLLMFIDYLRTIAINGTNEIGNPVKLYISSINCESSFSYLESKHYKLSLLRTFTLYDITSVDELTLDEVKKWMNSLIRTSICISESCEIQMVNFINTQSKIVNTL